MKKILLTLLLITLPTVSYAETFCENIADTAESAIKFRYSYNNSKPETLRIINQVYDSFQGKVSKLELNNFRTYISNIVDDAYNQPDFEGNKYEFIQSFKYKWNAQCIKDNQ